MSADLLAALGEPADTFIEIDFETYWSADFQLKKATTEGYIRDPKFQVIGVGVAVGDRAPTWLEHEEFKRWAATVDWTRVAVGAHNAAFDCAILSWRYDIHPAFLIDTLSMARAVHGTEVGGSLEKLALHYGVGQKGKEVLDAKGKRREQFTREEWERYGRYCCSDVRLARAIFWRMVDAGFPEHELFAIDSTIRKFTEPKIVLDAPLLQRSLEDERQRKAGLMAKIDADRSVLMSNDKLAALLVSMGIDPPMKVSVAKTKAARKKDPEADDVYTYAFAKSDPGMKELLEHEDDEVRWIIEARLAAKSTIVETRTERLLGISKRGPLPVLLKYCGAHTGRFSGADKVNLQNLNRGSNLRAALLAPEGHLFAVADSNAIEARVLAWEAGHTGLVDAFRAGRDVYNEFAGVVYNRKVDRNLELPDGTKPDEVPGAVGKQSILGSGYQMSWGTSAKAYLAGPMGSPPIQFTESDARAMGVDVAEFAADEWNMRRLVQIPTRLSRHEMIVHCAVCKHLIDTYRRENAPIVAFWETCEEALHAMLDGRETSFGPDGCFRTSKNTLHLPSGRCLRYPGLEYKPRRRGHREEYAGFSYLGKGGKKREKTYGGSLTENITQAVARDVIVEQLLWLRADGFHAVSTTHDEIILVVSEKDAPRAVEALSRRMKAAPEWAPGLPLKAKAKAAKSYGDCK